MRRGQRPWDHAGTVNRAAWVEQRSLPSGRIEHPCTIQTLVTQAQEATEGAQARWKGWSVKSSSKSHAMKGLRAEK